MSTDWDAVHLPGLSPGHVVVVTGGTGAIGLETARALVALGVSVGLLARSAERVAEVTAQLGCPDRVAGQVADVTDRAAMTRAIDALCDQLGAVGGLVHAAAVGSVAHPLDTVGELEIDTILGTNVKGALVSTLACLPSMRSIGGGSVVYVSSVAAHRAHPDHAVYGASKAALNRLALQMAVDLGKDGIRVNSVSPGQTPTQLRAFDEPPGTPPREAMSRRVTGESLPLGRRGELDDYVGPTLFLLSDMSRYVTGIDVPVEGGALAVL